MKVVKEKNGDISVVDDGNPLVFGFRQFSKTRYYDVLKDQFDCIDQMHIGMYYYLDGGCDYEFKVEWILQGNNVAAYVRLFDDCWKYMDDILPIMTMLKSFDGKVPTPNEFKEKLLSLGLSDLSMAMDTNDKNQA